MILKMYSRAILAVLFLFSAYVDCQVDSAWVVKNYTKQEEQVTMRDGVKLFTVIYSPIDKTEKHPVLIVRTPYSVAPYGSNVFSSRLYNSHWSNYIREKYIIVMQDVRGCYMSEGEFADVRPFLPVKKTKSQIDESTDAYDTIDWLIKNVNGNNGNVGVFGISYPGFYSTMAALSGHPALKAVSPQAPVTDWFMGDDFHHNGAFALMDGFGFYYSFGQPHPKPSTTHGKRFNYHSTDAYQFFLKQGSLKNLSLYMDSSAFWKEMMEHPNYDEWWKSRDARRNCVDVKPAILVVGGTFDAEDCFGAWNLYKAIRKQSPKTNNRLLMGPWYHGGWNRSDGSALGNIRFGSKTSQYYQQQAEIPFFNYYLKGAGTNTLAGATVFFTGTNNWKTFESWPPKTSNRKIYFSDYHSLTFEKPTHTNSFSGYTSDPAKPVPYAEGVQLARTREYMSDDQRFASRRPDVLVFETMELESDITLAGPVVADLKVSLSTTDADFVVKLIDVFPDEFAYDSSFCCKTTLNEPNMGGYQMLVRGEIMRGKFRKSFERPEAFAPGKVETVRYELPDVAHTFKKGHKLMVQVQSTWFPLFDRNPQQFTDIYKCADNAFVPCEIKLFHSAEAASNLELPVIIE